jgi:hypothetical protein
LRVASECAPILVTGKVPKRLARCMDRMVSEFAALYEEPPKRNGARW